MASLPNVAQGDPHVKAHNDERGEINGLIDRADESLAYARNGVYATTQAAIAPQLVMKKSVHNPILKTSDTTLPSIYYPTILMVEGLISNPLGKYYMWFSTDHGQGNGRIALAYSNDLEGPWTFYGVVYQYNLVVGGSGTETETPCVLWDPVKLRLIMYHQQANPTGAVASQVTMAAIGTDGVNWTSIGIILDVRQQTSWRGPLHTGYFRAFNFGNGFIGYSLLQGQENPTFAVWYSSDGVRWVLDSRPLGYESQYLPPNRRIEWNTTNIVIWRGQYLWIGLVSSFNSGAETRSTYWAVAPLGQDGRTLMGPPQRLFDPTQSWENNETGQGHAFIDDGRLVMVWRSGDGSTKEFAFGVAFADPLAEKAPAIDHTGETVAYSLVRDPLGKFVPLGRVEHALRWSPAFDATFPSWITTPVGTSTAQTITNSTNPPRVRAEVTAATINSAARMIFGPSISVSQVEEIEFTLDGLAFSHDNGFSMRMEIGSTSQNAGIDYRQDNNEIVDNGTKGRFRTHAPGTSNQYYVDRERAVYFGKLNGNGRRPSNITLLWRPFEREAHILMADQVMASMSYDASEISTNVGVYCMFTLNTVVAELRSLTFEAVSVKVRYN